MHSKWSRGNLFLKRPFLCLLAGGWNGTESSGIEGMLLACTVAELCLVRPRNHDSPWLSYRFCVIIAAQRCCWVIRSFRRRVRLALRLLRFYHNYNFCCTTAIRTYLNGPSSTAKLIIFRQIFDSYAEWAAVLPDSGRDSFTSWYRPPSINNTLEHQLLGRRTGV